MRVKLSCYEMEKQCSLSVEDYLKAFLETEVKPLWPKGWMQARWVGVSRCVQVALSCCCSVIGWWGVNEVFVLALIGQWYFHPVTQRMEAGGGQKPAAKLKCDEDLVLE